MVEIIKKSGSIDWRLCRRLPPLQRPPAIFLTPAKKKGRLTTHCYDYHHPADIGDATLHVLTNPFGKMYHDHKNKFEEDTHTRTKMVDDMFYEKKKKDKETAVDVRSVTSHNSARGWKQPSSLFCANKPPTN